jgi:hypothetical protein
MDSKAIFPLLTSPPNNPPQLCVAAYLAFGLDEPVYGAVLLGLILPQVGWLESGNAVMCGFL